MHSNHPHLADEETKAHINETNPEAAGPGLKWDLRPVVWLHQHRGLFFFPELWIYQADTYTVMISFIHLGQWFSSSLLSSRTLSSNSNLSSELHLSKTHKSCVWTALAEVGLGPSNQAIWLQGGPWNTWRSMSVVWKPTTKPQTLRVPFKDSLICIRQLLVSSLPSRLILIINSEVDKAGHIILNLQMSKLRPNGV